ncbi:MAG: hypothetical protein SFV22_02645 [Saprospiraceae bacterium]|nr:hypothetical protein [Saprospiraceae bacterium]
MKKTQLLAVFIFGCLVPLNAQWEQLGQPNHFFIGDITQFGTTLYASNREGIYKRQPGDNTWQAVANTPATFNPGAFFELGSHLFSHSVLGIYRSDNGNAWEDVSPRPGAFMYYRNAGNAIFAIERFQTPNCHVLRSIDLGQTWDTVLTTGNINQFYYFGKVGSQYYLWIRANGIPGNGIGIYRSGDLGQTWEYISNIAVSATADLTRAVQIDDRIFVPGSTTNPGIHWSDNGGQDWFFSSAGLPAVGIYNVPRLYVRDNMLFMRAEIFNKPYYFRSDDQGVNWAPMADNLLAPIHSDVLVGEDQVFLVGNFNSLYRSQNDGQNFSSINFVADDDFRPTGVWESGNYVAFHGEGGIYFSENGGVDWQQNNAGIPPYEHTVFQLFHQGFFLYALTSAGIYISADSGLSWELIQNGFPELHTYSIGAEQITKMSGFMFVAGSSGIYRSIGSGSNWTETSFSTTNERASLITVLNDELYALSLYTNRVFRFNPIGSSWSLMSELPTGNYRFFVGADNKLICGGGSNYLVSDNGGQTWDARTFSGLGSFNAARMTSSGGRYYLRGSTPGPAYIAISTDLVNWEKSFMDTEFTPNLQDILVKDSLVFASFSPSGFYWSKDYGQTWEKVLDPTAPEMTFYDMELDDQYLYAATALYGVWRMPLSNLINVGVEIPGAPLLAATLHPNPATENLNVQFTLSQPSTITIRLADASGRDLGLLHRVQRPGGPVTEQLELPAHLPAGAYWLRIETLEGNAVLPFQKK